MYLIYTPITLLHLWLFLLTTISGDAKFKWSIKEFLENPVKFICDMDNNACSLQEEKEDFILQEILPHLEELWGRCSSSNAKIYEILARISCSRKSAKVVRQALQLLLYLICKDDFDSCHENVLVVEVGIRSSILSPEGLFKTDRNSERELKLYAYSRILSSLVIQQVRKGELRIETLKQDLKKLRKELKQFGDKLENKKKDGIRYSIEFILEAIPCLLKPQDKLKVLLAECQEFCSNRKITSGELKVLQGLKKDSKCIDLHCILIYLHGKVSPWFCNFLFFLTGLESLEQFKPMRVFLDRGLPTLVCLKLSNVGVNFFAVQMLCWWVEIVVIFPIGSKFLISHFPGI